MITLSVKINSLAVDVQIENNALHFMLADGREISAPLEWFPRLRDATDDQRRKWRFIGNGVGVHWSDVDEDIAVSTLMRNG